MKAKESQKRRDKLEPEVIDYFRREISKIKVSGLTFFRRGKFFYVYMEGLPLCRFTYQGDKETWGFAIYRYSTASYTDTEFGFPVRGKIRDCLTTALGAYNYL